MHKVNKGSADLIYGEGLRVAAWKKMSPDEKYNVFVGLMGDLRRFKAAGVRMFHPEYSDAEVEREVARLFLCARS